LPARKYWLKSETWQTAVRSAALICGLLTIPAPLAFARPSPETNSARQSPASCEILYAGFVGVMETHNHKGSGVVQLRDTLRGPEYADVCSESFVPIAWESCRDWILSRFPRHSGLLTQAESAAAPAIILVGHSTGGWAMLRVARDLRNKGIPVALTVQLDSVGITDRTVPSNVKASAIFHARDILMFLTTKNIRAEDPLHTKLIANVVVKNASHLSITRDPRVRNLVLSTVLALREDRATLAETKQ
jgi:hypothetical protein